MKRFFRKTSTPNTPTTAITASTTHTMLNVNFKILDERLRDKLPRYATPGSAGLDLSALLDEALTLKANDCALVRTGLALYIADPAYCAMILPRSGLGHKNGIVLGNLVGLIDSDYQGEIQISVWNRSTTDYVLQPFTRLAQLVIVPVMQAQFNEVSEFPSSQRGSGGFGSSGH